MDRLLAIVLGLGLTVGMVLAPVAPAGGAQKKPGPSTGLKHPQQPPSGAVPLTTDIAITEFKADAGTCRIWVTWTNKGTRKIDAVLREKVEIHTQPIQVADSMNHVVLEPGASFSHGAGADPGLKIQGAQEALVWIDADGALAESNEANNAVTKTLTCGRSQPDLIPSTISFATYWVYTDSQGHACLGLRATPIIMNIGTAATAKNFTVKVEADSGADRAWVVSREYHVAGLAEGASLKLANFEANTCLWFANNPQMRQDSPRRFKLTVDSKGSVPESLETNNETIIAH